MARPRSIGGLLLRLAVLYARRRPRWCGALACVLVALVWSRGGGGVSSPHTGELQVGVLRDGFVLAHGEPAERRVVELDVEGSVRRALPWQHRGDHRVVGTSAGAAAGWLEDGKLRLALVEDNDDLGTWGKAARQLCDGVANNDARFAVSWLEADDSVWFVHGPVAAAASATGAGAPVLSRLEVARTHWCGVASAQDNVALFWRSADRLQFAMCSRKRCSALPASFALDRKVPLLGFGCLRNACLIALPHAAGEVRLALLTESSRTRWTRPWKTPSSTISIIGVGDRAFAIGHATDNGAEVVRIDSDGQVTSLWRDPAATTTPALAWSSGRLLIARYRGDTVAHHVISLAR
jgi:hypothetical protein